MEQGTIILPPLRQDLQLQRTTASADGESQWLLYDPLNHAFHALNRKTFILLQHWRADEASKIMEAASHEAGSPYTDEDINTVLGFLYHHSLADTPRGGDSNTLIEDHIKKQEMSARKLLHSYVFFRIPLIKPQKLLTRAAPLTEFFFSRIFWGIMGVLALAGLGLALRQWDQFVSTFFGFLSVEGVIGYGIAIILTKIAHEFGHAFAAHRYGCRVTSLGIGLMLLFPILYADTTDAWRLKSRRKRLVIGASGMGAEIIIAIFATLAWNVLPEGSLRSITFFLATTSWIMTIVINLNPFMRFDGYYLLGDALDFKNLQPRSNELGRWWLRETLFQAGDQCPENLPQNLHRGLILYAFGVWIYRFFLFVGIALLLHAFIIKAVAIALVVIEIGWFIVRPVVLEVRHWPALIGRGQGHRRLVSASAFAALAAVFFLPWQSVVRAPAVLEPAHEATLFAGIPGRIETIHVVHGQRVMRGDALVELHSPALATQVTLSLQRIDLLQARVNRQATDALDRAQLNILTRELTGEREKLAGFQKLQDDMIIRSPLDGEVHGIAHGLHKGRWINAHIAVMHIRGHAPAITTAYVSEDDIARISAGAKASFFADDPLLAKTPMQVRAIAPAGSRVVDKPILASVHGGAIATRENARGEIVPVRGLFRVSLDTAYVSDRDVRGIVHIKGTRRSPASTVWRRVVAIYNRETGA